MKSVRQRAILDIIQSRDIDTQEQLLEELEAQKAAVDRAISAKTQEIADYQAQITSASSEQGTYEEVCYPLLSWRRLLHGEQTLCQDVDGEAGNVYFYGCAEF